MTKLKNSEFGYHRFFGKRDEMDDMDWIVFEFNSKDGDTNKTNFIRLHLDPVKDGPLRIAEALRNAAVSIEETFEK